MITSSTTRSFRMSSPSFLQRTARSLGQPWKPMSVLLVCRGCQETVITSLVPVDAHILVLQGSFSAALPFSTAAFEWPWQLPSLSGTYSFMSCPSFSWQMIHCSQWDTSYSDPKQIDHSVLGCSFPSGASNSRNDPESIDYEFWGCFSHDGVKLLMCKPVNWYHSIIQQWLASVSPQAILSLCWVDSLFPDPPHLSTCHSSKYVQKPFLTWKEI